MKGIEKEVKRLEEIGLTEDEIGNQGEWL